MNESGTSPDQGTVRLVAVGDSITYADSPDFAKGEFGSESWLHYVIGEEVSFVGGWARWGATTAEMARNAEPIDADVLVIMAGTNDTALGSPFRETSKNITEIAKTIGADNVILAGIPPIDHSPQIAEDFNHELEELAGERGWHWIDTGASVRTGSNTFVSGMASDGVHPTARGAQNLGEAISAAIQENFP